MNARHVVPLLALLVPAALGCGSAPVDDAGDDVTEDALSPTISGTERAAVARQRVDGFSFDHPTRTGLSIFRAGLYWQDHQLDDMRYPQPRMCASNVSKVLLLGGVERYSAEGVYSVIRKVGAQGGRVHRLPQPTVSGSTLDKRAFLAELNAVDGGRIPVGTLVAGCLTRECDAVAGEQHIGIVGQVDSAGVVWIWHNNWYRPENEGGAWKSHMIYSDRHELYERDGLRRQWMATPWLKVRRNLWGAITDVKSVLPALDDMDPLGGAYDKPKYHVTLVLMPELVAELAR